MRKLLLVVNLSAQPLDRRCFELPIKSMVSPLHKTFPAFGLKPSRMRSTSSKVRLSSGIVRKKIFVAVGDSCNYEPCFIIQRFSSEHALSSAKTRNIVPLQLVPRIIMRLCLHFIRLHCGDWVLLFIKVTCLFLRRVSTLRVGNLPRLQPKFSPSRVHPWKVVSPLLPRWVNQRRRPTFSTIASRTSLNLVESSLDSVSTISYGKHRAATFPCCHNSWG